MKNEEIKRQNYEKIKATASVLFFIHGLENTNMYQIAAASGISKVSLYKYFATKYDIAKELFYETLHRKAEDFRDEWKETPGETGADELKRLLKYIGQASEEDMVFSALYMEYTMYVQRFHASEVSAFFRDVDECIKPAFLSALEKGRADGSLSFPEDPDTVYEVATDLLKGCSGFFYLRNGGEMSQKKQEILKIQLQCAIDSIMRMLTKD